LPSFSIRLWLLWLQQKLIGPTFGFLWDIGLEILENTLYLSYFLVFDALDFRFSDFSDWIIGITYLWNSLILPLLILLLITNTTTSNSTNLLIGSLWNEKLAFCFSTELAIIPTLKRGSVYGRRKLASFKQVYQSNYLKWRFLIWKFL